MRWFKHDTTASQDVKIILLKKRYGLEGYGLYFSILEMLAGRMQKENVEEWGYLDKLQSSEMITEMIGIEVKKGKEIIKYCIEIELFVLDNGRLFCPKILNRLDEYATKIKAKIGNVPTGSGLKRDNVSTVSVLNRIEKNRIEKNRKEEKRVQREGSTIDYLKKIPEKDIEEFTLVYNLNRSQLLSKCDDLVNYCQSKGRIYKDYKALLRISVKKDFGLRQSNKVNYVEFVPDDVLSGQGPDSVHNGLNQKLPELSDEDRQKAVDRIAKMKADLLKKTAISEALNKEILQEK